MKKLLFLCAVLCAAPLFAQTENTTEDPTTTSRNEIKVNAPYTIAGFPEISYERLLNDTSSLGLSVGFAVDDDFSRRFMAIPYYRFFFGEKKRAAGFFIEVNGALITEEAEKFDSPSESEFGLGLGFSVGAKVLNKSDWVAEIFLGAGRNFSGAEGINEAYPRVGISIGKRF